LRNPSAFFSGQRPLVLSRLEISASLRIAVAAPHPDDFDAIAITMRWFQKNGNEIALAVLTSGTSGVENGFAGAGTPEAKRKVREAEQRASCELFGLDPARLEFLRLSEDFEAHPLPTGDNIAMVRAFLARFHPDIIFLPHGNDTNVAHQRTHEFVTGIVEKERLSVFLCLNEDPKSLGIRRDLTVGFDESEAEWKACLLRLHASQHERNLRTRGRGFDERILSMNRRAAVELGSSARYAEAFELACYEHGRLQSA
jgi:LmbE family N-acetylglucosaminyl deacetylase